MNNNIYHQTIIEFENKRLNKEFMIKQRQEDLYSRFPRLKAINFELNTLGLQLAKTLITDYNSDMLNDFQIFSENLTAEKNEILRSAGYPKNYLEISYDCKKCNDSGFINSTVCSCFTKALISKYYQQSNMIKILAEENFDNFRLDYYDARTKNFSVSPNLNIQNILSKTLQFVKEFNDTEDNLYLYGNPGLGKTYLSHCIAKELLDQGYIVIYQTAADLIDTIRKAKFVSNDPLLECLYECDLLIIDDLGTENLTEFANNELFNLINRRLMDKKNHVISTNLTIKDLETRYSSRLTSRVLGNFNFLKFIGDDIRLKKAKIL